MTELTETSTFVVDYKRYDADLRDATSHDTYRFHYFAPKTDEEVGSTMFYQPFSTMTLEQRLGVTDQEERKKLLGQTFVETRRDQCEIEKARVHRAELREQGYEPLTMDMIPECVQRWVIHSQLPIEFHRVMDAWMEGPEALRKLIQLYAPPAMVKEYSDTKDLEAFPLLRHKLRIWVKEAA